MTTPTGATLLMRALEAEGVRHIFGYPGGAIMPVYDALLDSPIEHILTRHEQGAVFAADGHARSSGRVGVTLATSGPGATNLVTGLANAFMDSVPLVAITGQVPQALMGTDAFQETDIFGMAMPVVKHHYLVRRVADLPRVIQQAFRVARSGRPGPVLIDLPKDVQLADASGLHPLHPVTDSVESPDPVALDAACRLLREAERPVVYAGGGIGMAGAVDAFVRFVETTGLPVATTLKGVGVLPATHPQCLGMMGMHGLAAANHALQEADLLVVLGARFDDRATGRLDGFAPGAKVIHADVDPAEPDKLRASHVTLLGDLRAALEQLATVGPLAIERWRTRCRELVAEHPLRHDAPGDGVHAPALIRQLTERAPAGTIVACDVGQHQMWVAQHGVFHHPACHLTSGGLGAMGYGLPAAIGAALARPDVPVICVSGDGSIMMNIQELATLRRYGLPVKIVLLDNQALGMVRQWQEAFFAERFSEIDLRDNPDFGGLATACGVETFRVDRRSDVDDAIERLLAADGPVLMHVPIDRATNVWPLVPPGATNGEMLLERQPQEVAS